MPTILSGSRRRPALVVTAAVVAIALAVSAYVLLGAKFNPRSVAEGPLDAGVERGITLPLRPQDKGAAWGSLVLTNGSPDSSITLDSVAFESTMGQLKQTTSPYVWDENRYKVSGAGALDAYQLPLPEAWHRVPKHPLQGYVLKPATPATVNSDGLPPEAEVVFEFGVPEKASGFSAVTVSYHMGATAYRKTFKISFVLCPSNDQGLCT